MKQDFTKQEIKFAFYAEEKQDQGNNYDPNSAYNTSGNLFNSAYREFKRNQDYFDYADISDIIRIINSIISKKVNNPKSKFYITG